MKKRLINLKSLLSLLLLFVGMNAFATEEVAYTLNCPKSTSNSAYATYYDATVNGVTWKAPGNQYADAAWRIGGKLSTATDRYIYTQTAIEDEITSIDISYGTTSVTVNTVKVDVYSTAALAAAGGNGDISSVESSFAASSTVKVSRPENVSWKGRYYRFTWNLTSSAASSNKYFILSGINFNKEKEISEGQTETFTTFPSDSYKAYIGETFTSPVATVTGGENLSPTYSSDNETVATVNATTGVVTLVAAGTAKITASFAETEEYTSSSATYTLSVGNVYANIQALQKGTTSATATPMKVTLENVKVTGVKEVNAYLSDGTYGVIVYTANHGLTAGQVINGTLEASSLLYYGTCEITNFSSTGLTITEGELGDAPVVSIGDLAVANQSKYCKLENVAYDASAKTFSDGTNSIAYYDGLATTPSLIDGKSYDVVGIYSYRSANQFFPISVVEKVVAVEAPEFSLATGTYKGTQSVTITCATKGAEIYYTTDDSDPTESTTAVKYSSAIEVAATSTIKAVAKNGDAWSNVVSRTYTIVPLYANIAAAKDAMTATAAADAVDCYITLTDAVVTYVNGSNYYIEDGTAGMLIYNPSDGVKNKLTKSGLVLNGDMKCAGYIYNGLHEYTKNFDFTDVTITEGTEIPCTTLTIAELLEDGAMDVYESMRVKIIGADVTAALASRKATITKDEKSIQIYEKIKDALASTDLANTNVTVDVVGYPGINNSTNQINVWEASDVVLNAVNRTTATGKFGTICLPTSALYEGATIYSATLDKENSLVVLTEVSDDMVAGTPYIYQATEDNQLFACDADVVATPVAAAPLTGVFAATKLAAGDLVMQTKDGVQKFYTVAEGSEPTLSAYKAYIKATDAAGVKALSIGFEETDGINAINALVNGDAKIYDINGRQLQTLQKGINIVNGVKVLVK